MKIGYISRFLIIQTVMAVAFFSVLPAMDAGLDVGLAQNTVRKIILTVDGIQVQKIRTYQANYNMLLSQDLGDHWNIGGNISGVNSLVGYANGIMLTPEQSVFSGSVAFDPSEMFQFSLEYSLTASVFIEKAVFAETLVESEPSFNFTFVAPFGSDWFSLSTVLTAAYYFSPLTRNFGFSLGILPEFTVPSWALSLGISLSAGYSLQGYRGATEPGFDGVTPALSLTWSPGDVFSLCLSAGYYFSLSRSEAVRVLSSAPYYQLTAGFFISGDDEYDDLSDPDMNI